MQTLPEIAASTTSLTLPNGQSVNVRPLDLTGLSQAAERLTEQRLRAVPDPSTTIPLLAQFPPASIQVALRELRDQRQQALDVGLEDALAWLVSDPFRIIESLIRCIQAEPVPPSSEVMQALSTEAGSRFLNRWLQLSGLQSADPTKLPSAMEKPEAVQPAGADAESSKS